jgi:ABC-type Fe3+-siderophore transport system permease subunit
MSGTSLKLYRLRGWFVLYFVLKSVVGAVVAAAVLKPAQLSRLGRFNERNFSTASLLFFSLVVTALILAVALLIFARLLERKNWARLLLLVIGWLTVFGAILSLLSSTQMADMGAWVSHWLPEWDWQKLVNFDRIQKIFEILFWGYLIFVLQLDEEVKKDFFPPAPVEKGPEK